jgi:hypothetical protein
MRKSAIGASSSAGMRRQPGDFNSLLITSFRASFQPTLPLPVLLELHFLVHWKIRFPYQRNGGVGKEGTFFAKNIKGE